MISTLLLLTLAQPLPPGHPPPQGRAPSAEELIAKLDNTPGLRDREKTFEIAASLARLYFGAGRYVDAQHYYRQALDKAKPAVELREQQLRLIKTGVLHDDDTDDRCAPSAEVTLDSALATARTHAAAKKPVSVVACLNSALLPVGEVEVLLGNAAFLSRDAAGAVTAYERALTLNAKNHDARYARAAVWLDTQGEDVATLQRVKEELERVLNEAPGFRSATNVKRLLARTRTAIEKGGLLKAGVGKDDMVAMKPPEVRQPGQAPVLTPEVIEAFANAPRTPEMAENFVKLIETAEDSLAQGKFQEALDSYKQVMPFQPDNPRLRAGMAWTMVKLNRQPMADNVWRVALGAPHEIDALGSRLKAKGDGDGAQALWQRLRETAPGYQVKEQ